MSKKNKTILIVVIALLVIAIIAAGLFILKHHKTNSNGDSQEITLDDKEVKYQTDEEIAEYSSAINSIAGIWYNERDQKYFKLEPSDGMTVAYGYLCDKDGNIDEETKFEWFHLDGTVYSIEINGSDTEDEYMYWAYDAENKKLVCTSNSDVTISLVSLTSETSQD